MTPNTPILTLGKYQLVYRPNEEYLHLKNLEAKTPFLFSILKTIVNIGSFIAFIRLFVYGTMTLGTPITILLGTLFIILFLLALNIGSFVSLFKVINHSKTPKLRNNNQKSTGVLDWCIIIVLSPICGFGFYLSHFLKIPSHAPALLVLSAIIVVTAMPYYLYRLYKLLF